MPTVNRKAPNKTHTQSVRFRKPAWSKEAASKWCKEHDFYTDGFENTDNEFRFRQYDPNDKKFRYRSFDKNLPKGIYFIIGYLKSANNSEIESELSALFLSHMKYGINN